MDGLIMELSCNTHAASFVKGMYPDECDNISMLQTALGLSGDFYFTYTYPLSVKAGFPHTLIPGMTGEDLLALGRADYERIYAEEEASAGNPGHIPGMLNRARSPGPYGIWGHDFSDLYFEGVTIDTTKMIVDFNMGS